MLLLNLASIYLKCGVLLRKSDSLLKEFEFFKNKFQFIQSPLTINYKTKIFLLFRINYYKIENFRESEDFKFLKDKLHIIKNSTFDGKEDLESQLNTYKDSLTIIPEPRNKNNNIPICYYCGYLTGKKEVLIYELFQKKCLKCGELDQLSIYGIDYVTENIPDAYFNVPKESIGNLIKVGEGLDPVTKKIKIDLKNKLYPYVLSNALEGVTIYRVDSRDSFTRLGGNSFDATTLWSLLTLTCDYKEPDEAVNDAIQGNNSLIDLSVGDIYGGNYDQFGLDSNLIASSFGKIDKKTNINQVDKKDISRSLVTLYSTVASQTTAMISEYEGINKVLLLGNPYTSLKLMQMLQMCTEIFSMNKVNTIFSDFSDYFEIIGMLVELDQKGILEIEIDEEYDEVI
jgi:pantothenate kinase